MTADAVQVRQCGNLGIITLNRPQALNALSLAMVRDITSTLLKWQADAGVGAVVLQGAARPGKPPAFCAGGDIRFFHQAALGGDPRIEDFFTEEYALDHLIHTYRKPTIVLMDGITMGGGMGLAQGASVRVVTEHSALAMPETQIGLFPDVGGGWFLARCPGRIGEYLALTGESVDAADAIAIGWADFVVASGTLAALTDGLSGQPMTHAAQVRAAVAVHAAAPGPALLPQRQADIDRHFSQPDMPAIMASLQADASAWAQSTAQGMRKRSPLMLAVTLEQIRRARNAESLADELRVERGLVRRCLSLRPGAASETVEGIRALAVDKDRQPRWNPPRIEDVTSEQVAAFFDSPWPAHAHPLRDL